MRPTLAIALALTLGMAAVSPADAADVIHLVGGRTVVGHIRRAVNGDWVVTAEGRTTVIARDDVLSIDVTGRASGDPVHSAWRLQSVRAAARAVDDPANGVDLYRQFLAGSVDPVSADAARREMATWQERVDQRLVRLGDRWVVPAAREQAVADSIAYADVARQLVKDGRLAEADPVLSAALLIDPKNVSAQYLQGVSRLQQDQLALARQAFEAVAAGMPDHGPTRLNLAIVAWRQGRYADALAQYDAAMQAAPGNPLVLADVSLALAAIDAASPRVARGALATRVTDRYAAQQKALTDRMTRAGLHPFGRAWLTDAQLADVRKAQQQDQAKLGELSAELEKSQDKVRQIDLAIAEVEVQMRRSAGASVTPGPWLASYDGDSGAGLTPVYFDLQNDADLLRQRRQRAAQQLDGLGQQAAALRARIAGQPAPGVAEEPQPVGAEGTPMVTPAR